MYLVRQSHHYPLSVSKTFFSDKYITKNYLIFFFSLCVLYHSLLVRFELLYYERKRTRQEVKIVAEFWDDNCSILYS